MGIGEIVLFIVFSFQYFAVWNKMLRNMITRSFFPPNLPMGPTASTANLTNYLFTKLINQDLLYLNELCRIWCAVTGPLLVI